MFKGKRGQVFLLAAIVIGLAIVSVTIIYNKIKEYPLITDYKELSENYLTEAPKIINYARYNDEVEADRLNAFTNIYTDAAKQRDPNFGVFYTFRDESGVVHILNTLNNRVLNIKIIDTSSGAVTGSVESYGDIQAEGNVCVTGAGGCFTTGTDLSNYQGTYSQDIEVQTVGNQEIIVCVNDDLCTYPLPGILNILTNTEEPIDEAPIEAPLTDSTTTQ